MSIKKIILIILTFLSIGVLLFRFGGQFTTVFKIKQKAGIRVLSNPTGAKVFIDDKDVGKTPYEDQNLFDQEIKVRLEQDASASAKLFWQAQLKLNKETLAVVNRDLAPDLTSSAGEVLTLEKGKGATIISTPTAANVEIDGKDYGLTPVSFDIANGEHTFTIKKGNYLPRSIRATIPENYDLNINVDLALSEADLSNISTPPIAKTPKVVVRSTPTGFLRVREKGDVSSKELARVSPGDELVLLEEGEAWDRVRLSNGVEGYVSKSYVEKSKE